MALRPHSSCLQGKMLHWRIRPVQAVFALQFHQSCLCFHGPLLSWFSVPVWQASSYRSISCLEHFFYTFILFFFFSLYAFFLHLPSFCFSLLWCASHCFFCFPFTSVLCTYFAVLVISTTEGSVCFFSPFSCLFLVFSFLLPYTGNWASFQPDER